MNQIRAMLAAACQQWKTLTISGGNLSFQIVSIPTVAIFAWIAQQRGDPAVLTYILIGAPLITIWNGAVFRVGYTLTNELSNQTLQFVYISRTPMVVVALGKALVQIVYGLPMGILALATVFLINRTVPQVADIGLLLCSLIFAIVGLTIACLFFSPLMVLVGGRAGFFNAIIPFGLILSGFIFPVDRLPFVLEVMARFMPTSWAMDSIWLSIQGTGSWQPVIASWGMCLLTSAGLSGVTYLLFRIVERRIRITGSLDTY
jgi:ABC-2 type transport system permease protein